MIITDDICNDLTWKILQLFEDHLDELSEGILYDKVLDLLIKELESNGYVNHN